MTDAEKPEADAQEQQQPEPGDPHGPLPPDAPEADAMEQGKLKPPPTEDEEGLPGEPAGNEPA
jgi:hypothetical protein